MSRGPYKRANRLMVKDNAHRVGDVLTIDGIRWSIRRIDGQDVALDAMNSLTGIRWNTTLNNLPAPSKENTR